METSILARWKTWENKLGTENKAAYRSLIGLTPILFFALFLSSTWLSTISAASDSVDHLLEQAKAFVGSDYERAKQLLIQAIDSAASTASVHGETKARLSLLDLIRGHGFLHDFELYNEQLAQLDSLPVEELDDGKRIRVLLDLGKAELAIAQRRPSDGIGPARKALELAKELGFADLIGTAQVILGMALLVDRSDKFYLTEDDPIVQESSNLLNEGLEHPLHPAFQALQADGWVALAAIYDMRGDHARAERILTENAAPTSSEPIARAYHLFFRAGFVGSSDRSLASNLLDEALRIAEKEQNAKMRATFLLTITGSLLWQEKLDQAERAFYEATKLLAEGSDHLGFIMEKLEKDILPVVERFDLAPQGARMIERVMPQLESPGSKHKLMALYAKLAKYYARTGEIGHFNSVLDKAVRQVRVEPNLQALQEIYHAYSNLFLYVSPKTAAEIQREAILLSNENIALIWPGLNTAISVALETGNYQDAVDWALIGLAWAAPILDNHPHDSIEEFLVVAGYAMTAVGRFDLAFDAFTLARLRVSKSHGYWEEQIDLGFATLFALVGDNRAAKVYLNTVRFSPEKNFKIEAGRWLLFDKGGQVYARLGSWVKAEELFRDCIFDTTELNHLLDAEALCRWHLGQLLAETGDIDGAGKEIDAAFGAIVKKKQLSLLYYDISTELDFQRLRAGYKSGVRESAQTNLEVLNKMPESARVLAYRAAYQAFALVAKDKAEVANTEVETLARTLKMLQREPYISVRELRALMWVGIVLGNYGLDDLAIEIYRHLIGRVEYVRHLLAEKLHRQAFGTTINELFESLANIYLRRGDSKSIREALDVYESNRARSVGDLRGITVRREGIVSHQELGHRGTLAAARTDLEKTWKERSGPASQRSTEAAGLLLDLKLASHQGVEQPQDTATESIQIPQFRLPPPLDLPKLQEALDTSLAVIVYHLSENFPGAWVITSESIRWRRLAPLHEIEERVLRFRTELQSFEHNWQVRVSDAGKRAYTTLVSPLASEIVGKSRLVVIPDKVLFAVPFEALIFPDGPDSGRHLIEKYQVSYQLSLQLLLQLKGQRSTADRSQGKAMLVGGTGTQEAPTAGESDSAPRFSYLPGAHDEIEKISQTIGADRTVILFGAEATKQKFREGIEHFQIIHIASHAVANPVDPNLSFVLMSGKDPFLTLWDVSQLNLSADIVVLSACETGQGLVASGEGIWGFQSQFLASGAKNVVVSLWRVEDSSTGELMAKFYAAMAPGMRGLARALWRTKLALLEDGKVKHPFFWAAFVIYGSLD